MIINTLEAETQGTNKEPLVFDLNNDGELSVTSSENGIYFDYKQDGFLEKTPWAAQGDGVLIADLNHNGTVDGETELLSINQVAWNQQGLVNNAYKTLKGYDTNSDGVINANDAIFADLKIMTIDSQLHSLDEYDNFMGTEIISVPIRTPNNRYFAQNTKPLLKNIA